MPELLEPTDPRGGNRGLMDSPRDRGLDIRERGLPTRATRTEIPAPVPVPDAAAAPTGVPLLLSDHVSKWYGPVIGVNQVTLELRSGITGLVGHNGSGKSSLMRLAAGQTRPDLGSVQVCGEDAWTARAKLHVGYCPELDAFYEEMSGRRFVETMGRMCGFTRRAARERTGAVLDLVGMSERADRPLAGYSKGMRQRIKLAQALLHD